MTEFVIEFNKKILYNEKCLVRPEAAKGQTLKDTTVDGNKWLFHSLCANGLKSSYLWMKGESFCEICEISSL